MTATATPGREELRGEIAQALCCQGDCIRGEDACWKYTTSGHKKITDAIVAIFDRLAAKPADEGLYLVWSNQHRAWWRPNSAGYTDDVKRAGRYSRAEAMSISFHGRDGWDSPKGVPDELAIAERDVPVFTASPSTTGEPKR